MRPTERLYRDFSSKTEFRMYRDNETHNEILISDQTGEIVKSYCANASFSPIAYRLRDKTQIVLHTDQFFKIDPENPPTHRQMIDHDKRFKKI